MRTVALLTQKGGAGKSTLAASLAVAAAGAGERVIALDLDPQASLVRWGKRREAAHAPNTVITEPFEARAPAAARCRYRWARRRWLYVCCLRHSGRRQRGRPARCESVDLCLLPVRPTRLDLEATAATFRTAYLARRNAAFVLNQCPPTNRSARSSRRQRNCRASASSPSRRSPRASIFRMRWPPASASPSMPAQAGPRRRSKRCGAGFAFSSKAPQARPPPRLDRGNSRPL